MDRDQAEEFRFIKWTLISAALMLASLIPLTVLDSRLPQPVIITYLVVGGLAWAMCGVMLVYSLRTEPDRAGVLGAFALCTAAAIAWPVAAIGLGIWSIARWQHGRTLCRRLR